MINSIQSFQNPARLGTNKQTNVANSPNFGTTLIYEGLTDSASKAIERIRTDESVPADFVQAINRWLDKGKELLGKNNPETTAHLRIEDIQAYQNPPSIQGTLSVTHKGETEPVRVHTYYIKREDGPGFDGLAMTSAHNTAIGNISERVGNQSPKTNAIAELYGRAKK